MRKEICHNENRSDMNRRANIKLLLEKLATLIQKVVTTLEPSQQLQFDRAYQQLKKMLCNSDTNKHFQALLHFKKTILALQNRCEIQSVKTINVLCRQIDGYLQYEMQKNNMLLQLPNELLIKILLHLNGEDIICVSNLCLYLYHLCQDANLRRSVAPPTTQLCGRANHQVTDRP